ncbi:MAG: hypothetical protein Q4A35_04105 [Candidatus Gracilibacteria bacterium]|nr:hypothetical protein [Candidatus Gracilibacteria bacterium]
MASLNTQKYHPDLEISETQGNFSLKNLNENIQIAEKNLENYSPKIREIFSEIVTKINLLQENNQNIPTALTKFLENIAQKTQPTAISMDTIASIIS